MFAIISAEINATNWPYVNQCHNCAILENWDAGTIIATGRIWRIEKGRTRYL